MVLNNKEQVGFVKKFQEHMRNLYFERDKKRDLSKNVLKLVEEFGELANALLKGDRDSMEEEFADVIAWLFSLANLFDIDIEKSAYKKYPLSGCPYCSSIPCQCDNF